MVSFALRAALAFALLALLGLAGAGAAGAAERALDRATLQNLGALAPAHKLTIDAFPVGPTKLLAMHMERVSVYARDAHLVVEAAAGPLEAARSSQIFLRGYSDDGKTRVALVLNPDLSVAHGNGSGPEGSFVLHATKKSGGASTLVASALEADLPAGFNFEYRCGNENENLDVTALNGITSQLQSAITAQATTSSATLKEAVVAIDTDSLFMSRLFANNPASATNWIAGMFNTMNVMYERDLNVRLLIGTTILRTSPAGDPYTSFTPNATTAELNVFANFWKTNKSEVQRSFVILLSGAIATTVNGCSASGIAWINQYCQGGFPNGNNTVGSYSLTQVCTSLAIDPNGAFDARIVGHEIGHNFGAYHTHCTNVSSGAAPTGTNTIDTCYNQETTNPACYSGTPSCPAGGSGTLMSYCNFTSVSGCAPNTQNQLQFHPTHVSVIEAKPGYTGACLNSSDQIFASGFQ